MPRPPAIVGPNGSARTALRDTGERDAAYDDSEEYQRTDDLVADDGLLIVDDDYVVPPRRSGKSDEKYRKRLYDEAAKWSAAAKQSLAETAKLSHFDARTYPDRGRLRKATHLYFRRSNKIKAALEQLPPRPSRMEELARKRALPSRRIGRAILTISGPVFVVGLFAIGAAGILYSVMVGLPALKVWLNGPEADFSTTGAHTLTMRADYRGIYVTNCKLGNASFNCFFDTGASAGDVIMLLDEATARRAGIDTSQLNFNHSIETVSGSTGTAYARVRNLHIGPFVVDNAEVLISKAEQSPASVATGFTRHYKISIANYTMTITE